MERLAGCPDIVRLHEAAFGGPPGGVPTAAFVLVRSAAVCAATCEPCGQCLPGGLQHTQHIHGLHCRFHAPSCQAAKSPCHGLCAQMDYCSETLVGWAQPRSWQLDDAQLVAVALPVARAVAAMHSLQPPLAHRWVHGGSVAGCANAGTASCALGSWLFPQQVVYTHAWLPATAALCPRDLKAENVLLGPAGGWVLCDFGSASSRHGVLESAHDIALEEEVRLQLRESSPMDAHCCAACDRLEQAGAARLQLQGIHSPAAPPPRRWCASTRPQPIVRQRWVGWVAAQAPQHRLLGGLRDVTGHARPSCPKHAAG